LKRPSIATGVSFGLTSGVITTLGLIVGLHSGTHSTLAVLGGVLTIAIADALSDALGIHIAEEARADRSSREIWQATLATLGTKFFMALTFVVPIALLPLTQAIVASVAWGFLVLAMLSWRLARAQGAPWWKAVGEHLLIAALVVTVSHLVGDWTAAVIGGEQR
jgi:VIT1/CCC1 family predicted Fe2+/Mn2+ transporter